MHPPTKQHDPDSEGLPPGAVLPDPHEFRLGQYKARFVVSLFSLILLVVLLLINVRYRMLIAGCAVLMLLLTGYHAVCFAREKRNAPTQ